MYRSILENGVETSDLFYGTGVVYKTQTDKAASSEETIRAAIDGGLRAFDTSRAYGDAESILGEVIKDKKRDSVFISTKLRNKAQFNGNIREEFENSLSALGVEYVDLFLMHWPVTDHYLTSWKKIEGLYEEGLCRAIGVCNCNIHHLEEIKAEANIKPMVNQFECHPLFTQDELRTYCKENKIQVMAYTPVARMDERLLKTCLVPISKKYNKTVPQVILRWHQQIGNIPVFNTANAEHLVKNTDIYDFELSHEEIVQINKININSRLRYDPDNCDFTKL